MAERKQFTIIGADGLYPDNTIEQTIFAPKEGQDYSFEYTQTNLWPSGSPFPKPWSSIPESLRNRVEGIMLLKPSFTALDLDLFPSLKVIVRMGVGYDRLSRPALAARNVAVCNVPDYGTCEVADHALALALCLRRGILLHHDLQRQTPPAVWAPVEGSPLVARLQTQTFGIVGFGRIGMAAAMRAKAMGFERVVFYDPFVANGVEKALGVERTREIREVFRLGNVVSLHCPCTRITRGMVGWELVKEMPRGSVLVNTARGEILDLDAVERGLKEGILAGVGLDVLPEEPIPEDEGKVHPLITAYREKEEWLVGRMVLTCHSAFYSPQSFVDIRVKSAQTMRDVLIDGLDSNVITPEMD